MMVREWAESHRRWLPAVVGLTLFSGYLVLLIMSLASHAPSQLPGLFDYPSAYVGDALLLPIAAGVLTSGAAMLSRVRAERRWSALAAAAAMAAALSVQLIWLADDRPTLNWTLSQPHTFNAAGIWHAVYVVGTAGFFAFILTLLSMRIAKATRGQTAPAVEKMLRGGGPVVVLCCLLGYDALAVRDSSSLTLASRSSVMAIATAAGVIVVMGIAALGRRVVLLGRALLLGLCTAASLELVLLAPWSSDRHQVLGAAGASLSGVGLALLTLVPGRGLKASYASYRPTMPTVIAAAALLAVGLPALWIYGAASSSAGNWSRAWPWLLWYAAAVVAVPAIVVGRFDWLLQALDVMAVFVFIGLIATAAVYVPHLRNVSDLGQTASLAVAAIIGTVLFPIVWLRFGSQVEGERGGAQAGTFSLTEVARLSATPILVMLILAALSASFSLLSFTLATAGERRYVADSDGFVHFPVLLVCGLALVVMGYLLTLAWRRQSLRRAARFAGPLLVAVWPISLISLGVAPMPPVTTIALVGGLLTALWSANTALNNVALLRGDRPDHPLWFYVASISFSGLVSCYFAMTMALAESPAHVYTWFAGISTAALVVTVHSLLSVLFGLVARSSDTRTTRHGIAHNLIQDASVATILILLALVVPAATLMHISPAEGLWTRLLSTFAICGPLLTFFLFPYQRLGKANLQHLQWEIKTRSDDPASLIGKLRLEQKVLRRNAILIEAARQGLDDPPQNRFLRLLNAHIRNQNLLGAMITALSIVGLIVILGGNDGLAFGYLRKLYRSDPHPESASDGL
jgi:hypothetical protein